MPNLSEDQRLGIRNAILERMNDGRVPHGTFAAVAVQFECSPDTVRRIWQRNLASGKSGSVDGNVAARIKANSGRKGYDKGKLLQRLGELPFHLRRKQRTIAHALGVGLGTVNRLVANGDIVRHSNKLTPELMPFHCVRRVNFTLSIVDPRMSAFDNFYDVVHLDEKWFYHDRDYLLPHEEPPHCQHASSRRPCYW
ncbi:TPA: hypothetical protein N0F65_003635 [Lagenidium giganteum]|uniref:DUF7769 domain-containing protein n=1 Tax=Lagenidium giganteum TaxID=4803 RepID=A0AAV2YQT1_9STRA|nr:TPA: hypothetical protein N0F65_003635 [Lagenidium giganteum]